MALIFLSLMSITILIAIWLFMFFALDDTVLNGHFKKKLQRYFGVDNGSI